MKRRIIVTFEAKRESSTKSVKTVLTWERDITPDELEKVVGAMNEAIDKLKDQLGSGKKE